MAESITDIDPALLRNLRNAQAVWGIESRQCKTCWDLLMEQMHGSPDAMPALLRQIERLNLASDGPMQSKSIPN